MIKKTELRKATGFLVVHKKSGRNYSVVGTCKMEDSVKGWIEGVLYVGPDRLTGKWTTFVREANDFQKKFERLNP